MGGAAISERLLHGVAAVFAAGVVAACCSGGIARFAGSGGGWSVREDRVCFLLRPGDSVRLLKAQYRAGPVLEQVLHVLLRIRHALQLQPTPVIIHGVAGVDQRLSEAWRWFIYVARATASTTCVFCCSPHVI